MGCTGVFRFSKSKREGGEKKMKTLAKILLMLVMTLGIIGYAASANARIGQTGSLDGCTGEEAGECVVIDEDGIPHEGLCQFDSALCKVNTIELLHTGNWALSTCDNPQAQNACNQVFPDPNGNFVKTICVREEIDNDGDGVITSPVEILEQIDFVKDAIKQILDRIAFLEDQLANETDPEVIAKLEADIAYGYQKLANYEGQLAELELLLESADEVYLHLTCVAPSVNEQACMDVVANPVVDTTEFWPGVCRYPVICGDFRLHPTKEACEVTLDPPLSGCDAGETCLNCEKCVSSCEQGALCEAENECGYGVCEGLNPSNLCMYAIHPSITCEQISMYELYYLGGKSICATMYRSAEVGENCYIHPEYNVPILECMGEPVNQSLCTDLDEAILSYRFSDGADEKPDMCTWIVDPGDTGVTCDTWPDLCDYFFTSGQAGTYCTNLDLDCTKLQPGDQCNAEQVCNSFELPRATPEFCGQFGPNDNCYLASGELCTWNVVYDKCMPIMDYVCESWCKAYNELPVPDAQNNCTQNEACEWDSENQICSQVSMLQFHCVGINKENGYNLWEAICAMPINGILGTYFQAGSGEPGFCNCCLDPDGDGVCSDVDNCPMMYNPKQADYDGDGEGDACECLADCMCFNPIGCANIMYPTPEGDPDCIECIDADGDGICDNAVNGCLADNCPGVPNTNQANQDGDIKGDACDCDSEDGACTAEMWCLKLKEFDHECCFDVDYDDQGNMVGDGFCKWDEDAACLDNPKAWLDINYGPGADDFKCDGHDNDCNGIADDKYKPFQCGVCEESLDPVEYLATAGGSSSQCGPLCVTDSVCVGGEESCTVVPPRFYRDEDKDGYGKEKDFVESCDLVPGYVLPKLDANGQPLFDCDDQDPLRFPFAPDRCMRDPDTSELLVEDMGCGDGFDDINCDEICVDKDNDLFGDVNNPPADWIEGCGYKQTMKMQSCSYMCNWFLDRNDCDDNDYWTNPAQPPERWGEKDRNCDGISCSIKTDYPNGTDCVGTPIVVTNMEELKAYMVDYGWTGNKYSALRIAGDLVGEHIHIHSPCTIDIVKGVKFSSGGEGMMASAAPAPGSRVGPTLCIDSTRGIQNDNGYVIDGFNKVGILSENGKAYVGEGSKVNVTGVKKALDMSADPVANAELLIGAGDKAYIGKNSDVSVKGLIRVLTPKKYAKPTADSSIAGNIEAYDVLVSSNRTASIEPNTVIKADTIKVYSEGMDNDSMAMVGQKAHVIIGKTASVSANGGVRTWVDQYAMFEGPAPSTVLYLNCEGNPDGCKIHKKAIFNVDELAGNCIGEMFCPDGTAACVGDCEADLRKEKCTQTYANVIGKLQRERYAAEMDCWNAYDGDLKAADACAMAANDAFIAAQKDAGLEAEACAMRYVSAADICFGNCENGCGEEICPEGANDCLGACKGDVKACQEPCSMVYSACSDPCYYTYVDAEALCGVLYPKGSEDWYRCLYDAVIDYRKCLNPCEIERALCVLPCNMESQVCNALCSARCDAVMK